MNNLLSVKVLTPRDVLFEGKANAVSSKNSSGVFDILPEHANFITIIEKQPIIVLTEKNEKITYNFSQAIIYNVQNKVYIFAEPLTII